PGPVPGHRPSAAPSAPAPAEAAPESHPHAIVPVVTDPSEWGRVDDDGTAWVRTADGERVIGSWQAGDAAEGLAHFGRRYDDIATEVALLEARLHSGAGDAKKTKAAAVALAETLPTAAVIGDVDSLAARLRAVIDHSDEVAAEHRRTRDAQRSEATARKEALAAEAEEIGAQSTQWKAAGDRLRAILDEWKTIRGVDRKVDDALWKRYSKAREAFNRRRGAHFADLDRERGAAKVRKEELVARAEALSSSTDWVETAHVFRDLLTEWKAAGRAPRDADDVLWQKFKGAQDVFFAARNAAQSEQNAEFEENARVKEQLLEQYGPSIDPAADLEGARTALRTLQDKWDAAGKVPRERMGDLEGKLRAIEKRVRDAADSEWRRTDPEAMARAAQFRERVEQFEDQARKADAAGKTKDAEKYRAQAQQWREWADAAQGALEER
ncbi:DUF349 domain-containing protein, partial [Rhodococcoides kroppenstedtii]|uniref:DUF349 domain-containing protein n=1 Tax=Rhodococcoides kroppenstedtii TaxID=293050 RepID=UPI001427D433